MAIYYRLQQTEIDLISAGLEWGVGSIGGFCVGSNFIVDHQRLSGSGECVCAWHNNYSDYFVCCHQSSRNV